jgi:RNA polymerase sigma factor (sigma-70 family)
MAMELFEEDRSWLQQQPGMSPWENGCSRLVQQLDAWLEEYCGGFGSRLPVGAGRIDYQRRLWHCWRHHWQDATLTSEGKADGRKVAEQIRQGRGFKKNGQLGGDPLRDVVLAQAVQLKDEGALALFAQEYQGFIVAQARRFEPAGQDATPGWNDLLIELGGYLRPPGKLERFTGACALRHWLRTVAQRWFLSRRTKEKRTTSLDEMMMPPADAATEKQEIFLITPECLQLFKKRVAETLLELSDRDRLLLLLKFVDGLQGKDIARVLGIAAGNVSRALEKALLALREALELPAKEFESGQQAFADCLAHLLEPGQRRSFGEMLFQALKESQAAGDMK